MASQLKCTLKESIMTITENTFQDFFDILTLSWPKTKTCFCIPDRWPVGALNLDSNKLIFFPQWSSLKNRTLQLSRYRKRKYQKVSNFLLCIFKVLKAITNPPEQRGDYDKTCKRMPYFMQDCCGSGLSKQFRIRSIGVPNSILF